MADVSRPVGATPLSVGSIPGVGPFTPGPMADYMPHGTATMPSGQPLDPRDFTDQYNTQLTLQQERQYQAWLLQQSWLQGRDMSQDNYNYDMRGAFLAGANQAANGHFTDQFKKPNHPTFSTQSQYHGQDGFTGGSWTQDGTGRWSFTPGPTNLQFYSPQELQSYFQRADPNVTLVLPNQPSMQDYVTQQFLGGRQ